ncbi:MAG: hypothetical protein QM727_13555 [Niabella sp.]
MIPDIRKEFNEAFSQEKYEAYLQELNSFHGGGDFRVGETPVFVPRAFTQQMLDTCEAVIDVMLKPGFKTDTDRAIPPGYAVPNEEPYPAVIAFDFGVCSDGREGYEPQLIEMQGFPTLFGYQIMQSAVFARHFNLPDNFSPLLGGHTHETYLQTLKEVIVGQHAPENVILLEIFPHQQKTKIDFYFTQDFLGIKPVCITELIKKGNKLFYEDNGVEIPVKRIYNRVIFDELAQQSPKVKEKAAILFEPLEVEWVPHPAWFYRLSKFTLPLIDHPHIPQTRYLDTVKDLPADLENYVLKPLFSFAGQGVVIDVSPDDIAAVKDPENWILQKKVNYAPVIVTPDGPAKAEIRLFYFWKPGADRPIPGSNLARLSKGKMIGVRYNKDKIWTGSSFCLFEK